MTLHPLLQSKLEPLLERQRRKRRWQSLALGWLLAAAFCGLLLVLQHGVGWSSILALPVAGFAGIALTIIALARARSRAPDWRSLARDIEWAHPELEGRLLTAIQQVPAAEGDLNVLQERVLWETLQDDNRSRWIELFPRSHLHLSQVLGVTAFCLFAFALSQLRIPAGHGIFVANDDLNVTVSPGDVTLERGSSLVVMARFAASLPARVELVLEPAVRGTNRIMLVKSLSDPLFGITIPELNSNLVYHLEYGGKRTRDFKATVFEYPRLEQADADLTFPPYTGLAPQHIKNTRRLSAVEGSHADLSLQFNKVIERASLVSRDTNGSTMALEIDPNRPLANLRNFRFDASRTYDLRLTDKEGRTNKVPAQFVFYALKNRAPELKMTSPRGDSRPSALEEISFDGTVWDDFGVEAYGISCAVAGRDIQTFELGKKVPAKEKRALHFVLRGEDLGLKPDDLLTWFAWADDIGPDGKVRRTTGDLYFAEVRPFDEIFREGQSMAGGSQQQQQGGMGGQAGRAAEIQKQIISATWNVLRKNKSQTAPADSNGRQREKESRPSEGSERSSSVEQDPDGRSLARFSLPSHVFGLPAFMAQQNDEPAQTSVPRSRPDRNRDPGVPPGEARPLPDDINVILEAQEQVLEQAKTARERQQDPRFSALWDAAANQMERALERLHAAAGSPAELPQALAAEQSAYQALLKLQEREYSVTRSRNRQSGQSGRQQQMRQQLDQLDLSKAQDRYETESQAQAPQTAQQREQLQVMNRLQELARRQQDINTRLKELQTALQEARTEEEREQIRKQLKRLQEDEQQLLADSDELRQRMERPENQSRMTDQRRQLEQARNNLEQAAEAAQQGQPSQALASGTRAQRQLQDMREQLRQQSAGEFDQQLRQMRNDARELARRQEEIQQKMNAMNDSSRRTLSDSELNKDTADALAQQHQRLTNLVEQATQLSQQAEEAEPLMSRTLYDTLRNFSQDDLSTLKQFREDLMNRGRMSRELYDQMKQTEDSGAKTLDLTSELLRQGLTAEATAAQERAHAGINQLKRGVERAAESVLGDEAESLRRARDELDQLANQLSREIAQGEGTNTPGGGQQLASAQNGQEREAQGRSGQSQPQQPGTRAEQQQAQQQSGNGQPQGQSEQQAQNQRGESQNGPQPGPQQGRSPGDRNSDLARNDQPNGASPSATERAGSRQRGARGQNNPNPSAGGNRGQANAGGRRGNDAPFNFDRLFDGRGGLNGGPITGEDFAPWSDRLREVEELVDTPALQTDVARARERARQMRQDYKRNDKKPDWAEVRLQVLKPLIEVRDRLAEELARREPSENLVPIDRDPVPARYSELVRRYYEELGKDNRPQPPGQ